ncbi:HAMP domain-containing protein [bacterium]|nr:HAMP domain-containing protein [bacterium]
MKLWVRIALLNVLTVVILAGLIGVSMVSTVTTSLRAELNRQGESISKNLSDRISNYVLLNDIYKTKEAIEEVLKTEKDVEYIFVTEKSGRLFAHTFPNGFPPDILTWNPLFDKNLNVHLLDTEKGLIRDVGVKIFEGMPIELHIGLKEERISEVLKKIKNVLITLTAFFILIGSVLSFFLSKLTTRPLYALVSFTRSLSNGEFGKKIVINSKDEVGKLAETFNRLSFELKLYDEKMEESYKQMLRTEKLTALGTLSAGLAHELRNPLTSVKMLFQALEKNPAITPEDIRVVLSEVDRMDELLARFLRFARKDEFDLSEVDINVTIERIIDLIHYHSEDKSIKPFLNLSELPTIKADRAMVEQALLNIVINAVDSIQKDGQLSITTNKEDGYAVVSVTDTGLGIPEDIKDKVFDPFFTTKIDGTGLGLSIVFNIVELHNGKIDFVSNDQKTTFTLKLPISR